MTVSRWAAAASSFALLGGGPALAQLTPAEEEAAVIQMDCVFDRIPDADMIALARAYETRSASVPDANADSVNQVSDGCRQAHGWDAERQALADEATVAASVVEVLVEDLIALGLKDPNAFIGAWQALPIADLQVLLSDGAGAQPDFAAKMRGVVLAAGVPDAEPAIAKALLVYEAATFGAMLSEQWLAVAERAKAAGAASGSGGN